MACMRAAGLCWRWADLWLGGALQCLQEAGVGCMSKLSSSFAEASSWRCVEAGCRLSACEGRGAIQCCGDSWDSTRAWCSTVTSSYRPVCIPPDLAMPPLDSLTMAPASPPGADMHVAVQGTTSAAAEVMLRNQGAADVAFSICAAPGTQLVGLPPWLNVNPCSGVLPAQVHTLVKTGSGLGPTSLCPVVKAAE